MLAAAVAALVAAPVALATEPREPLGHDGRWITDARGRVVILHGAAVIPEGIDKPLETAEKAGFVKADARFLARQGLNVVRLGAFQQAYERKPGAFSDKYLDSFARTQRLLARAGIFTLFDFHQDMLGARYQGRGFADWFLLDDGQPNDPQFGFPGNYFFNSALNRAYDNLWANAAAPDGVGLQDHFAAAWRRVAARLGRRSHMVGYDLFNEPWPGSDWPTCASTEGCPAGGFDEVQLTAFHNRVIAAIRKADKRHIVFYEPNLEFDVGAKTTHGKVADPNAGFSFHNYCLGAAPGLPHVPDPAEACKDQGERRVFQNAEDHVARTGATLLLTEFGDVQDATIHRRLTELADEFMVGWTVWGWFRASGQIKQDPHKPPTRDNLNMDVLGAVVRPYPRVVAGTPKSYGFDPETKRFELTFSTKLPNGRPARRRRSEVFIPRLHYGRDYRLAVRGAEVTRGLRTQRVELRACRGAKLVSVTVTDESPRRRVRCPRRPPR